MSADSPCVGHAHCTDEQVERNRAFREAFGGPQDAVREIERHTLALTAQRFQRLNELLEKHGGLDLWHSETGTTLVIDHMAFTAGSLARAIDMATEGTR